MQLNNNIIDRLIDRQDNPELSYLNDNLESDINTINRFRIISLKYKLYLFLVFIGIYLIFSYFVLPARDNIGYKKKSLGELYIQTTAFDGKKKSLMKDSSLINSINLNSDKIVTCLNKNELCDQIDGDLRKDFSIVRSYLQIGDLSSKKMVVNEKFILANINEYLIRNMQDGGITKNNNGSIDRIQIGDPMNFEGKIYYVPIRLNITFENKDYLLDFISNVERKVLLNKDYRILYKIDQVSYNIVEYKDKQNVDIVLVAYYYQS